MQKITKKFSTFTSAIEKKLTPNISGYSLTYRYAILHVWCWGLIKSDMNEEQNLATELKEVISELNRLILKANESNIKVEVVNNRKIDFSALLAGMQQPLNSAIEIIIYKYL